MRHLKTDQIEELKKLLVSKLNKLEDYQEDVEAADPANDPERGSSNESGDDALESYNLIASGALENTTDLMIDEVKAALERIAKGTYGLDEKTGEPIPFERLKFFPEARTLVRPE